jgi:hypothetical protein
MLQQLILIRSPIFFFPSIEAPNCLNGVGVAQYIDGLRAGLPGFDSRQCKIFLFTTASRPKLGPTQPPIQWVALFWRVKRQGHEAYYWPPSSAEVMKGGAIHSLPHICLHSLMLNLLNIRTNLPV